MRGDGSRIKGQGEHSEGKESPSSGETRQTG
jgi:hypothetical protein